MFTMIKGSIFFACLVAIAATAHVQLGGEKKVEADKDFLTKQKAIFQLLIHVHQPLLVPEFKDIANNYDPEQYAGNFNDAKVFKYFLKMYRAGVVLNQKHVFSPLYKTHVHQAKSVFEVLYNAKDWTTFLNTAIWLRNNINDGLFVYSLSVAVLNRPDTQGIILPPLYEICPHLFVSTETIQKAYDVRMKGTTEGKDTVVIPTNYTGWYNVKNPELLTSYFTEDVGLNFYNYMYHVSYPHWMKKEHYGFKKERQGELFYFVQQQLLAHYRLERHANNMYEMKNYSFEEPNVVAYSPHLRYKTGVSVPSRPENLRLRDYDYADIERVKDFEYRIRTAIDSGFVTTVKGEKVPLTTENGIETLGRMIKMATTSINPKYYGALFHYSLNLLGHITDPYHQNQVAPSSLEQYQTMLRDPMYYRLYQRIHKLFVTYKKTLPVYTQELLHFPGVTVESVEVGKLMTYFEYFDIDLTNAVTVGKFEDDKALKIVARQPRLNNKEFTYRVTVNSNKDVTGMVSVFLAPKYDFSGVRELTLAERKDYMIQLDRFPYELKNGKTVIERNSKDFTVTVPDMTSFRVMYKKVEDALQGKSQFYINEKGHQYGFPGRLILPKGTKSGREYVVYVVVSPYTGTGTTETVRGITTFVTCGGEHVCGDSTPLGYPFDRHDYETEYHVPNIHKTEVLIYHKNMEHHADV